MTLTPPFSSEAQAAPFVAQKSQDDEAQVILPNMSFFPDIELFDFQLKYRVDASQHPKRQAQALQQALMTVNKELLNDNSTDHGVNWVCKQIRKGFFTLGDVPSVDYGDKTAKQIQYLNAVYARAKALLIKRYPALYLGKKDRNDNKDPEHNTADDYLQESRESIRGLMDKSRCSIELI